MSGTASIQDLKVKVSNKQVLSIALPITLAILVPQLNMLTNSIFLGHLSEEALGNAGITGVFYLIFAVAGNGLNNSLQTILSKYAGADKTAAFKTILAQGIRISLFLAAIFILFTWTLAPAIMKSISDPVAYPIEIEFIKIRIWGLPFLFLFQMGNALLVASLNSRLLMIGFAAEAFTNIFFDYVLIFGKLGFPNMGFNGAAVASILAECFGMITVLIVLYASGLKKRYQLFHSFRYHLSISKEIIRVAVPLIFQYVISVSTWLIFFILIEARGTVAKAISNTMRNVFGLAGVFVWAFASTANMMVSNLIGQKRNDLVLPVIKKITAWSLGFALVVCILLNLLPGLFFQMFNQDIGFAESGTDVIRIVTVGILFQSVAIIWLYSVTGTGQTRINLLIEVVAISIYMAYTWYFMKLNYISLAMAWSNEVVYWVIILLLSFLYIRSGRWKKAILPEAEDVRY